MLVGEIAAIGKELVVPFAIICGGETVKSIRARALVPCSVSTAKPFAESSAKLLGNGLVPVRVRQGGDTGTTGMAGGATPAQERRSGFGLKFAKVGCTATLVVANGNGGTGGVTCGALLWMLTS